VPPNAQPDRHEQYISSFRSYLDGEQQTRRRLDELTIAGAAGSLALSITFVDKIAHHPSSWSRLVLLAGWILMLFSLGVALVNLEYGAAGYAAARKELDRSYRSATLFNESIVEAWNRWVVRLNRASMILLFIGVCCLVVFAYANLGVNSPSAAKP